MGGDDPKKPACIADRVGDNVGDIARMGANLFGSFAEATCAALVVAAVAGDLSSNWASMMFPVIISSTGISMGFVTMLVANFVYPVKSSPKLRRC